MPRYNVRVPWAPLRWRVYSSIVDGFITPDMTFDELAEWRRREYGCRNGATDDETASLLSAKPQCNVMDYHDAVEYATFLNRMDPCPKCQCEDCGWSHHFDNEGYVALRFYCPECGITMFEAGISEEYEQVCERLRERWNA